MRDEADNGASDGAEGGKLYEFPSELRVLPSDQEHLLERTRELRVSSLRRPVLSARVQPLFERAVGLPRPLRAPRGPWGFRACA